MDRQAQRGALLIEVLIAVGVFVSGFVCAAQLLAVSIRLTQHARARALASLLAQQKLEQLLALDWDVDAAGTRTSDANTDLARDPQGSGGPGLSGGDIETLFASTTHYADYLDGAGHWIGGGDSPPPGSAFVRRWAVVPLDADPADTRVLAVVVTTIAAADAAGVTRAPQVRHPDEIWLIAVRPRGVTP